MAVLTTIAIIAGATLLVGGGIAAGTYFATEDDRARARIAQIDQEIKNCDTIINNFSGLKAKLQDGKNYLNDSKNNFTNGGHVYEGEPLANSEFNGCINKIDSAISNIDNIITRYNNDKSALIQEKNGLQAKLN